MAAEVSTVRPAGRTHLYWLDWLRFLAAFFVLIDHVRAFNWEGLSMYTDAEGSPGRAVFISLTSLGAQAVAVFFVLSGWLVGGCTITRMRAGTFDAAAYAADRLARVYVPLLPALLLTLAVARGLDSHPQPMQYVVSVFGLQEAFGIGKPEVNAPLWSLGYEIWFYVLAGGAAVACRRNSAGWTRLAGLACTAAAVWVCLSLDWTYLGCWLIGTAGGWLRNRLAPTARPWMAVAGVLVIAAGTILYQVHAEILPPLGGKPVRSMLNLAQLVAATGTLLLAASLSALAPRTRAGGWIERAGGRLAAFSYTLYLINYPVLCALLFCLGQVSAEVNASSLLRAFGWGAVCMLLALGMYALFERQTPRVRRWLRARFAPSERGLPAPGGERLVPVR